MLFRVRDEDRGDALQVRSILTAAFGSPEEARLVEDLRMAGDVVLALVAEDESGPVGHILFSRLTLSGAATSLAIKAAALAPLCVKPDRQRRGIGATLVSIALERLRMLGQDIVLVLGDPAYYGRFGFGAGAAKCLSTPYDGPHLQALALSEQGAKASGKVSYAPAFTRLG